MARDHARIYTSIWSDPEFRELPVGQQHMYFLLLSQPRVSFAGLLDYMPVRLAKLSAKATVRSVSATVSALEGRGFVVVDEETGELLIRTFIRHDGLLASPNVTKAMVKDFQAILSPTIRDIVVEELSRAHEGDSTLKGWPAVRESSPVLYGLITGKGSRKGSANG